MILLPQPPKCLIIFFLSTGVWAQGLVCTTWAMPPALFVSIIFWTRFSLLCLGQAGWWSSCLGLSCTGMTGVHHQLVFWGRVNWPQTKSFHLCLTHSWDYRCASPCLAPTCLFLIPLKYFSKIDHCIFGTIPTWSRWIYLKNVLQILFCSDCI
jgi:hypothetical protein